MPMPTNYGMPLTGNLKDELYATNANVLNCEMRSVYPEEEKPFWQWDKTVKAVTEPEKYDLSLYSLFERQNKKSFTGLPVTCKFQWETIK